MSKSEKLSGEIDLAELARDYYKLGLSQSQIAEGRNLKQAAVSVLLKRARDRGVVFVDIDPEFGKFGSEDSVKSTNLRDDFSLNDAFVVDVGQAATAGEKRGDDLHTIIANTVASQKLRTWIQPSGHVVIGGGRAPVKVARMIKRLAPSQRDVRISPISGRLWSGSWQMDGQDNLVRPLDSDDAARLLALAYEREPGTRFSQVGLSLYQDPQSVKRIIEEECVFNPGGGWKTEWGLQEPTRALVGVGVLHPESGHRIPELAKLIDENPKYKVSEQLREAASSFKKAMEFAKQQKLPDFGDVANRVFPALFLPSELNDENLDMDAIDRRYTELSSMLSELNSRAVVIDWEHLRKIPSVWAVAGGDLKINALWTLLIARHLETDRSRSIIKELATDARSADRLRKALRDFKALPEKHQNWYRNMVNKIFI